MAIVVLSRWKGSYEQALPILREASPLMKEAGATSVVAGVCHAGPDTGLIYTANTYPDWARRMEGCAGMPNFGAFWPSS